MKCNRTVFYLVQRPREHPRCSIRVYMDLAHQLRLSVDPERELGHYLRLPSQVILGFAPNNVANHRLVMDHNGFVIQIDRYPESLKEGCIELRHIVCILKPSLFHEHRLTEMTGTLGGRTPPRVLA